MNPRVWLPLLFWLTLGACANAFALPASSDGASRVLLEEFDLGARSGPALVKIDAAGNVWSALALKKAIIRFNPASGERTLFNLKPDAFPVGILPSSSGVLYYTDVGRNVIGRINPENGESSEIKLPTAAAWPFFLAETANGAIWFTERFANKIGMLNPKTGVIQETPLPTQGAQPAGLVAVRERLFFTENAAKQIGTLDTASGQIKEFPVPGKLQDPPYYGLSGIIDDKDGNLWFCELDGRIGKGEWREAEQNLLISETPLSDPAARPGGIFVDQAGRIWMTELDGNRISYMKPDRSGFVRFPLLTGAPDPRPLAPPEATARGQGAPDKKEENAKTSRPFGIYGGADGSIWFSEQYGGKLGRLKVLDSSAIHDPDDRIRSKWARQVKGDFADGGAAVKDETMVRRAIYLENGDVFEIDAGLLARQEKLKEALQAAAIPVRCDGAKCRLGPFLSGSWPENVTPKGAPKDAPKDASSGSDKTAAASLRIIVRPFQSGIREFPLPNAERVPGVIEYHPAARAYWFTEIGGFPLPRLGHIKPGEHIGRIDEAGEITEYKVPTAGAAPTSLKVDDRGAVWFTEQNAGKVGVFEQRGFREFAIPTPVSGPAGIAFDKKRDLIWFTEKKQSRIGFVNRLTGAVEELPTPDQNAEPSTIAVASNGAIWFDERSADYIVRYLPESGKFDRFLLPTKNSRVIGVTPDPRQSNKVWFLELSGNILGQLDASDGSIAQFPLPSAGSFPFKLFIDETGSVWLTEVFGNRIAVFNGKRFLEFDIPTQNAMPGGIAGNGDGVLRFTEQAGNRIGELDSR